MLIVGGLLVAIMTAAKTNPWRSVQTRTAFIQVNVDFRT